MLTTSIINRVRNSSTEIREGNGIGLLSLLLDKKPQLDVQQYLDLYQSKQHCVPFTIKSLSLLWKHKNITTHSPGKQKTVQNFPFKIQTETISFLCTSLAFHASLLSSPLSYYFSKVAFDMPSTFHKG